jgi:ABC-type dipeptide/oligopeptide/nickel transport system permease subunit
MSETNIETIKYKKESLWTKAFYKFIKDKWGMVALFIVFVYFLIALGVWLEFFGNHWDELLASGYSPVSMKHWFGTNINGQDILERVLFGTKTAFEVGIIVALSATFIGSVLGAVAGFSSGSFLDTIIMWLYGCLDAIPYYLFVAAIAFCLPDNPYSMHVAMISTFWSSTCRIIRGEVIKIKHLEYVEAAHSIGVAKVWIIFKHILPNTSHIILVQASIAFVSAIKSEVILSFLGLGVKEGTSWGIIIAESTNEVTAGFFNNFLAASGFLFVLVIAFNIFSDALQDALDPKKVG